MHRIKKPGRKVNVVQYGNQFTYKGDNDEIYLYKSTGVKYNVYDQKCTHIRYVTVKWRDILVTFVRINARTSGPTKYGLY